MNAVGAIRLSASSEVVFFLDTYKDKCSANIRKFITSEQYTGPTKSGIKLTKQQLEPLYKTLTDLSNDLETIQEGELLAIPLRQGCYISVRINYFNGAYGLDIRQYLSTEKYKGPSKKGIRIPLGHAKQVC
ncbi:MAG: PC4/YdbC family ssDNA-binding protein, partial [Planctomycetota bacterium]